MIRGSHESIVGTTLRGRIAQGAIWSAVGAAAGQACGLVSNVVLARLLGKVGYGELGLALSAANLLTAFAGAGLGVTLTKLAAEFRVSSPRSLRELPSAALWINGIGAGTLALSLLLGSKWLAVSFLRLPETRSSLVAAAAIIFFSAYQASQMGFLTGLECLREAAAIAAVRGLAGLLVIPAVALITGPTGAVWAYVAVAAATVGLTSVVSQRVGEKLGLRWRPATRETVTRVLKLGWKVVAANLVFLPVSWLLGLLLARREGLGSLAAYNAGNQWLSVVTFLGVAVSNMGLPVLASLKATGRKNAYREGVRALGWMSLAGTAVLAVPAAVLSPLIMRLYGPAFSHDWPILVATCVTGLMMSFNALVGAVLWSTESGSLAVWLSAMRGAILLVATYLLLPLGALGLSLGQLILAVVQAVITFPILLKTIDSVEAAATSDTDVRRGAFGPA